MPAYDHSNTREVLSNIGRRLASHGADHYRSAFRHILAVIRLPEQRDYMASLATVTAVAILVAGSLAATDYLIRSFEPGHQPVQTPQRAALIFVIVGLPFSLYMRVQAWTRVEPAIIASFSMFIPIAFFSLAAVIVFDQEQSNLPNLDAPESGRAFAKLIYIQMLRALPTVVMAPLAFWWVLTRLFRPASIPPEKRNG